MHYVGTGSHRSHLTVTVMVDEHGELVHARKWVPIGDWEPLLEGLRGSCPLKAVMEICLSCLWSHDLLEPTEVGL
jgi:hypothetical protein